MIRIPRPIAKHLFYLPAARYQAGSLPPVIRQLEQSQRDDREAIAALQQQKLRLLVEHARQHVPYYRERIADTLSGEGPGLLESLPTLVKADLQERHADLRSALDLGRITWKTSGGSTGQPVTVAKTRSAMLHELAATWRGYSWAGIEIGDSQARFWGVPLTLKARLNARLTDLVCNRYRLSAFDFSEEKLRGYADALERFAPDYYYGYVSMLVEFGRYVRDRGRPLNHRPKAIVSTSEVLSDADRAFLEATFSTRVYNEYGCGELGTIAHECESGGLHTSDENMIVEILDGDRRCGPGEPGEIVVTELNNRAMPLIRYRTGDFGTLSPERCECGRSLLVLDGLHGRAYDMVVSPSGKSFHGEFILYIFEEIKRRRPGIRQFQVQQLTPAEFVVRIVPEEGFDEAVEQVIIEEIRRHIDPAAEIRFEHVERIEREASGKMRLVKGIGRN